MKRYTEYTQNELAELSKETIETLIELEIAHAGILPEVRPQEPEYEPIDIQKTITMYQVGGLLFETQDEANALLGLKVYRDEYDYRGAGHDYHYPEKQDLDMTAVKLYDKQLVLAMSDRLKANKEKKDRYASMLQDYNKYLERTKAIRQDVSNAVWDAQSFFRDLTNAKKQHERYLELADGNKDTAEKFFRDAYKDREDLIEELFPAAE